MKLLASMKQTGAGTPTIQLYTNTYSVAPIITRQSAGNYLCTQAGQYTIDKTMCKPYGVINNAAGVYLPIADGASVIGYLSMYPIGNGNDVKIESYDASFSSVELSSLIDAADEIVVDIETTVL